MRGLVVAVLCLAACGDNLPGGPVQLVVAPEVTELAIAETGAAATFSLSLSRRPPTDVMVMLTSSDASEGQVSPASLTFTAVNFATPITVTVTGVDDAIVDGDQPFVVIADGAPFATALELAVVNSDNDDAGVTLSAPLAATTEAGGDTTLTIVLDTQPAGPVTIPLGSSDLTEGTVEPASVTFTPQNWNAPQTIVVTGVDDALADGSVAFTVTTMPATSSDPNYNGLDAADPGVSNIDDDTAGIVVTPTLGLVTSEHAQVAELSLVLAAEPSADVRIELSSSDPGEGAPSPAVLVFTPANWNAPQLVAITGEDDPFDDGDQGFTIVIAPATSADPAYSGIDPPDVAVTNIDDENPGFIVTPATNLVTSESGGQASFTVSLVSAPTADVTVALVSSDPLEGVAQPAALTFTTVDWATPKTITITGKNDDIADGARAYRINLAPAQSSDLAYQGFDPPDVGVTNTDNDSPGITVTPTNGLLVSELGDTATFQIVLNSEPTADVSIAIVSNDTTEGTVAPSAVTFTPLTWDTAQTITITGKNDPVADGNQVFQIFTNPAQSTDPGYAGFDAPNVFVTNFDDDNAQVVIDAAPLLLVSEAGGSATFTIVLTQAPTSAVTCSFTSLNPNEGTVAPPSVTFTAGDFAMERTITVTGVNDAIDDGDQLFVIRTNACTSSDPAYNGVNPRDVSARNADDD